MTYAVALLVVAFVFALGARVGFKLGAKAGFTTGAHARALVDATQSRTVAKLEGAVGTYVFELRPRQENDAHTDRDR